MLQMVSKPRRRHCSAPPITAQSQGRGNIVATKTMIIAIAIQSPMSPCPGSLQKSRNPTNANSAQNTASTYVRGAPAEITLRPAASESRGPQRNTRNVRAEASGKSGEPMPAMPSAMGSRLTTPRMAERICSTAGIVTFVFMSFASRGEQNCWLAFPSTCQKDATGSLPSMSDTGLGGWQARSCFLLIANIRG